MLLNGGTLDGKKILKPETVKMIMTNQLPKTAKYKDGYGYGLAGEVNLSTGEYSWSGAASTTFCINPENDLIIITLTQLMPSDYEYAGKFKKMVKGAIIK